MSAAERWVRERVFLYRHPVDMRKQIDCAEENINTHTQKVGVLQEIFVQHKTRVTNLTSQPAYVYKRVYCQRAPIENHIKELLFELNIDRTSCTRFFAN